MFRVKSSVSVPTTTTRGSYDEENSMYYQWKPPYLCVISIFFGYFLDYKYIN